MESTLTDRKKYSQKAFKPFISESFFLLLQLILEGELIAFGIIKDIMICIKK